MTKTQSYLERQSNWMMKYKKYLTDAIEREIMTLIVEW